MSDGSAIEWTDASWNPVRGCSRVSEGCRNCYAEGVAARFSKPGAPYEGLARFTPQGPRWTGKIRLVPELLEQPLHWRKPRRIFVNSMSDLFHEDVPDEFIAAVFGVMASAPQHTFQILTKRAERLPRWFAWLEQMADRAASVFDEDPLTWRRAHILRAAALRQGANVAKVSAGDIEERGWPLPNVQIGVSVEDRRARARIADLERTPAAVRLVSCEPLLEDLGDLQLEGTGIRWVIVGGESGHRARPLEVEWVRSIVQQCAAAGVACFVKQLGSAWTGPAYPFTDSKGADPEEWPADLRVRQYPEVTR